MSFRAVLLVDSDPEEQRSLADSLRRDDRRVEELSDGQDALAQLRSAPCDLLVAGPGRNGLDGLRLLRRARAIQPELKVIVTGDAEPSHVLTAIKHRAYGYFHRPVAPGPLAEMAQQALDAEAWKDDIRVVSGRPEWVTLDVRCKLEAAERTTHYMRQVHCDLGAPVREDIAVAFRELLMNAIEHGGKYDPRKRVRVSVVRVSHSVIVHIHDPGSGFSFDFLPHAAISNPADSPTKHAEVRAEQGQRPGGFGILMSRNLVDDLLYNERGNAVLFVKNF